MAVTNIRPTVVIPAIVFIALAAVFAFYLYQIGSGQQNISDLPSALIDEKIPEFSLPPIEGMTGGLSTADLKGGIALVNVWASWCPPCRVEHPILMRLAREGFAVYGINFKDKPADAKAFLARLGNPYRKIGADRSGRAAIEWGVYGYPETFIVDATGHVRYRHVGPILADDLKTTIYPILKRLAQ
jgi:cytochrome c biogenesis protein CcmG/thiol:disulfide interchange protein DsbE